MSENKMLCSADEHAFIEGAYKTFSKKLTKLHKMPAGSAFADSAQKIEFTVKLFEEALNAFEVRPGSERTKENLLSSEFLENFKKLTTFQMEFVGLIAEN